MGIEMETSWAWFFIDPNLKVGEDKTQRKSYSKRYYVAGVAEVIVKI